VSGRARLDTVTRLRIRLDGPLDLTRTLVPLRRGFGDPTMRLAGQRAWRATRTADGPATVALEVSGGELLAEAWGAGADRALEGVPALVGLLDDRAGFAPRHRLVADLDRRLRGLRLGRSGAVLEALVPAILEQKVTGEEARTAYRGLVRALGEVAPGPAKFDLRLPPAPERLAALPYHDYHPFGVERRRAELIRRVAGRAAWFETIVELPIEVGYRRLTALPGLGPWTAAEVAARALGDRDAVSIGDYHLPNLVAWALAGEPRAGDARMLELLEPYRPHRGRVVRLLEAGGVRTPRYGPRMAPRRIATI
jgi:3-methyladenine DNA glycosylase/8-oxoguanine DNA glycosylase